MKNTALHHALLIIALLFGQLASSVHAVSHLQSYPTGCEHPSYDGGCAVHINAAPSFSKYAHHHNHDHEHSHTEASSSSVDENCSLYHSLTNLVGGILAAPSVDLSLYPSIILATLSDVHIPQMHASLQRIRGPPHIS